MLGWIIQAGLALFFYALLLFLVRLAGKRLAGQTASFDLLVLVTLGVVLQKPLLKDGNDNAVVFVVVVFLAHLGQASATRRWRWLRWLIRGKPRPLVRDGVIDDGALEEERLSRDDLLAGLRKLGHERPEEVRIAVLEETGQISAVGK